MATRQFAALLSHRRLLATPLRRLTSRRVMATASAGPHEERSVRVAHILLKPEDTEVANSIEASLQGGLDFAELAKQHSSCPSKARGGELGWLTAGTFYPSFEQVAFSTPTGQVGRATTTRGLHVIKVLEDRVQAVIQQMYVHELAEALANPILLEEDGVQLVDVREQDEFDIARLPGFSLLPLSQAAEWAEKVDQMFDPERETVVLCHHGVRSMQVSQMLVAKGFKNVKNVVGGIHAYSQGVDASVPTY